METQTAGLLRFATFELDLRTRELRRDGGLVKLQDLPVKLLALLASRPGELVTREEIEKALWGESQFGDFEHGINTAMRKIREALGEDPEQPRFIETLPRKGYRFIAAVELMGPQGRATNTLLNTVAGPPVGNGPASAATLGPVAPVVPVEAGTTHVASEHGDAFVLPRGQARGLFLLAQAGYLAMYCVALYKYESLQEILGAIYVAPDLAPTVMVAAMCGIAVRLYLITSVGLDHPEAGDKYRKIFPVLFILDALWAASPLLLVRKIGVGLALAAAAALAYLPFAQRTLMLSSYKTASK